MRKVQLPDSLLVQAIRQVTSDLENLERSAGISLEAQVRVYDLYQELLRWKEEGYDLRAFDGFDQAAAAYGVVFDVLLQRLNRQHYHAGAGALGVKLCRSRRWIGVRRRILQNLSADDTTCLLPEFSSQ